MGLVTVVGSYNLGITFRLPELPVWGQTVASQEAVFSHGGKGSNQAVAARRFGARVAFVGSVGNDAAGLAARDMLRNEGIDIAGLVTADDMATGVGSIMLDPRGQNAIVIGAGANARLTPEVLLGMSQRPWRDGDVVLAQWEVPWATVEACFRESTGTRILNPAPAHSGLAGQPLDFADVLTPNETEAKLLVGLDPDNPIDHRALLDKLAEMARVPSIVLTLGEEGCLVLEQGAVWHISALAVPVADTTGAGDVFNGILAASLAAGLPLLEAAARGTVGASLSVRRPGVIDAVPTMAEVAARRADIQIQKE